MKSLSRWAFAARRTAVLAVAAVSLGACHDSTTPRTATTLAVSGGNSQTIVPGASLTSPLVVTVLDQDGAGLAGVTVTWAVMSGGGSLSTTSTTTDSNGQASNSSFTAGDAGDIVIRATVEGLNPVEFAVTVESTSDTGQP